MSTGDVPEHVRAVNRESARRNAANAPPLKPWQVAVLAPLFNPRPGRKRAAA